ncbi:ribonuclease H1 domain-containing protein [Virgibacillus alimentarius]|uniref:ribonuclease H1 domain-containing protein n=1 Tax=Virgibacillus alimentarius TaxID=698769 RepID=UPI000493653B|nr:ribonuclease H family protein [Virgibacillus alimentarius]
MSKAYYAVRNGRKKGIYSTWSECKEQTHKFSNAVYKKFTNLSDAEAFMNGENKPGARGKKKEASVNKTFLPQFYVDGSYNNEKELVGYGCVMVKEGIEIATKSGNAEIDKAENTWNIAGEITAALEAVEWAIANEFTEFMICYDYIGIENWANGSWNANKTMTADYADRMQEYQKYLNIHFFKIKAHSGNKFNERADELAKMEAQIL